VVFAKNKVLRQVTGTALGKSVTGYEIHHGRVVRSGDDPLVIDVEHGAEGSARGPVVGTHWHGLLTSDGFRRDYLSLVADQIGLGGFVVGEVSFELARMSQLDLIADLVEAELDMDFIARVVNTGPPPDMPTLTAALS
jgi:adenosylcobyric acid synthase